MISEPHKDIPKKIVDVFESLVSEEDSYHQTHKRRMLRTLDLLLKEKPKGKLLELGTSKVIPLSLQQLAPDLEVHVTDFQLDKPKSGQMPISIGQNSGEFPVYRIDLETQPLPVENESFDYVLCCEVIEHMELDPMFMMSEINRVLKPNGTLILTTPNITSTRGVWKMLRGQEPYFYMQYRKSPKLYRHNYEYSVIGLRSVVKSAGFSSSTVWSEDSFEDPILDDLARLREIGYPMVDVGDNIFAVVKKIREVINRHPTVIYSD